MELITRYDTADVAPSDRFAYWREAVCDSYVRLGCEAPNTSNFSGLIDISRYSNLSISRVAGKAHRVDRRKRDIGASSEPYFLLSLQTAESSQISQFGQTAVLSTGDMGLYSSTDPYTLELADDFSQTVVQLPVDRLVSRLPNAAGLAGRKIDGQSGIGKLVRENILAFSAHADAANPLLRSLVQDTLIDLIATGLATHGQDLVELSSPEQHVMLRTKSFIRTQIGNPDLDRHVVSAEVGMSVRRLNDIFAKEGTSLSRYIRETRLSAVARRLSDPRYASVSISEIAFQNGFSNMQNFSTLFRSTYAVSPRAYRADAMPDAT